MDDDAPPTSSWNDSTKTTVGVLVALVVVLIVAGIGVATVRDAAETIRKVVATTTTVAPQPVTTAPPASALSPEQSRVVEEVKAQVSALRGLPWKGDLPVRFVTKEELAQRVRDLNADDIAEDREELATDESVLKLLKLIPKDVAYVKTLDDIYAGAVLGFYDDESKELFVGGTATDPATKSTLAHELAHALTDQHFDYGTKARALDDQQRTEEGFAFTALIEGDASLLEALWQERHLSDSERRQAATGTGDIPALDKAPPYLLESIYFPYRDGLTFVRNRYRAGGFAEVDKAYRNPPTSTEHILHPETYAAGQAWTPPQLPDVATATGCGKVDAGTLGQFDMTELLALEISRSDARAAAAGWNGDAYTVVRCGTSLGLADRWQTDDPADAGRLADALVRWARGWSDASRPTEADGRFSGPSGSGRVLRGAGRVDLILADDAATVDRLARALGAS